MFYSPTATNRTNIVVIAALSFAILTYIAAAVGLVGTTTACLTAAFLGCCLATLLCVADARVLVAVVFVAALVVISLGIPSDAWDARSIWLFHGRRIFFDMDLYSQLDGYAGWSQNDYPVIVPTLMAGLAQLVGYWNESFPKVAGTLLLLPALLAIFRSFRNLWANSLFLVPLVMLGGIYLVNGYIDALVAVYAVASLASILKLRDGGVSPLSVLDASTFVLMTAVLVLLKNEALIIAASILAAALCDSLLTKRRLEWKLALMFGLAIVPLVFWKLALVSHHVVNDLAESNVAAKLAERIPNAFYSVFILQELLLRVWVLVPLAIVALVGWRQGSTSTTRISLLAAVAYVLVLYVVYMSTPHDVKWHLQTSASRTIMPVAMMLAYAAIRALDTWVAGRDLNRTIRGVENVD